MTNRFDKAAAEWDDNPTRLEMANKFAQEIKVLIKNSAFQSAFEYGCGTGNVSFQLKDEFQSIHLADTSQGMLDQLQKKVEEHHLDHFNPVLLNLETENYNKQFDVIYSLMTFHHVKDISNVLKAFSQMLIPSGILFIGDLAPEDGNFHTYPENQNVHWGFEKDELEQQLATHRFKMVEHKVFHNVERHHTGKRQNYELFILAAVHKNKL